MKKTISLLMGLILILNLIPISQANALRDSQEVLKGIPNPDALYKNVSFNDISNHWARESILKMASLSIIRGAGNQRYNPNGHLTKEEALALIIRLIGLESEAQRTGQALIANADTGKYQILGPSEEWSRGYIQVALARGILTPQELERITTITPPQQENIDKQFEKSMETYSKDKNLTDNQLNNIQAHLRQKLQLGYTWKVSATREETVVWLARAMNLTPIDGSNQQRIYNFPDWKETRTENISLMEAILQRGIMAGDDKGNLKPKGPLERGQMARLLNNVYEEVLLKRDYDIRTGRVEEIIDINETIKGQGAVNRQYLIKNHDNGLSIISTLDTRNPIDTTGFIALKNGRLIQPKDIKRYDHIKYHGDPEGNVVLVEVISNKVQEITGEVIDVDEELGLVALWDYDDNFHILRLPNSTHVYINGELSSIRDLPYAHEVRARVVAGTIVSLSGDLHYSEEGYISPGGRIHIGKVLYVNPNKNTLTLIEGNTETEFIVEAQTKIVKEGKDISLSSIREGDFVRLEFDQYKGNKPSKIYVAMDGKQISNLIKATLNQFNQTRGELYLTNLSYYEFGKWEDNQGDMKLALGAGTEVYLDGRRISREDLSKYRGREMYIATESSFGKEQALKIVLKSGHERRYYNTVDSITFGDMKLNVDYNEVFFDDSTIIVKDGRLVHPYNIMERDSIFVIAQGNKSYTASFISIEEPIKSAIRIYRGKIGSISQYGFNLATNTSTSYEKLEGTTWTTSKAANSFNISEDTRIIDIRGEDPEEVTVSKFTSSRFTGDREWWKYDNYYQKHVYAVEYDDMVVAINIIDTNTAAQIVTMARVSSINRREETIALKEMKDWSEFKGSWNMNNSNINLDVKDTVFIKDGKAVTLNDISQDDNLYILRRNTKGYIVIVR